MSDLADFHLIAATLESGSVMLLFDSPDGERSVSHQLSEVADVVFSRFRFPNTVASIRIENVLDLKPATPIVQSAFEIFGVDPVRFDYKREWAGSRIYFLETVCGEMVVIRCGALIERWIN